MKYLLILLIIPTLVQAQYEFDRIEGLVTASEQLIKNGDLTDGYDLLREVIFVIKINHGLYSPLQVPHLLTLVNRYKSLGDWKNLLDATANAEWVLQRNPPDIETYRELILALLYKPEDRTCLEMEGQVHTNQRQECVEFRYFLADSYIQATELQVKIAEHTNDKKDWLVASELAFLTAETVYGVDGPEIKWDVTETDVIQEVNLRVRSRYKKQHWTSVQKYALKRLQSLD